MWLALVLIIVLTVLSIYGAFIGAERAQQFFNRPPMVVYWTALAILLIIGIAAFRRLLRVPGLLLIHAGCVLILVGGMWGSQGGHNLQKRLFGIDKIRSGHMKIYEGYSEKDVILQNEDQKYLFSIEADFESDLYNHTVSEDLQQEFEKKQTPLSQHATVLVRPEGNAWEITDKLSKYYVRKEKGTLNVYDPTKELPFYIGLKDFRIEYYQPAYLQIETADGNVQRVTAEVGRQIDLGAEYGKAEIVRMFENFKMSIQDGKTIAFEDTRPGLNPALAVRITPLSGEATTHHVFSLHPGFGHTQGGPKMIYERPPYRAISDYISELEVIDKDGNAIAKKDIEVNHPLHYGGYHFYQYNYDHQASQYTVLEVVSDTGLYVVYAGYWTLCLGVIWHMWLRHIFSRFKAKST